MIGPLLNLCSNTSSVIEHINPNSSFKKEIFGTGSKNIIIPQGATQTIEDLYNQNGTIEFKDLTVSHGAKLKPVHTTAEAGRRSTQNRWHPLFLKCSGELNVQGEITSAGCGNRFYFWDDYNIISENVSPIPFINPPGVYGHSVDWVNFARFANYGMHNSFFTQQLFMVGGSGGGNHRYSTGSGVTKRWHNEHSRNRGMNCGGGSAGNHGNNGGNCGGLLILYFEKLIIAGKEYGKDPGCDISKVSANGLLFNGFNTYSGGCMVIAAKTINIGSAGTINSDAVSGQGHKFAYLNNLPMLSTGGDGSGWDPTQTGMRWDPTLEAYAIGPALGNTYYYDDGTGNGVPNQVAYGHSGNMCGGAGMAIGFKVDK